MRWTGRKLSFVKGFRFQLIKLKKLFSKLFGGPGFKWMSSLGWGHTPVPVPRLGLPMGYQGNDHPFSLSEFWRRSHKELNLWQCLVNLFHFVGAFSEFRKFLLFAGINIRGVSKSVKDYSREGFFLQNFLPAKVSSIKVCITYKDFSINVL